MSVPPMEERADWPAFWGEIEKRGLGGGTLLDRNRIIKMAFEFKNEPLERWRQTECDRFVRFLEERSQRRPARSMLRLAQLPANGIPDDVPLRE